MEVSGSAFIPPTPLVRQEGEGASSGVSLSHPFINRLNIHSIERPTFLTSKPHQKYDDRASTILTRPSRCGVSSSGTRLELMRWQRRVRTFDH
ncbi:hypothetical protein TNCV_3478061 [Trichonephila clavipes]|nr:hypothetical protein TNCV_3478061 [Trichonephila clavipes]